MTQGSRHLEVFAGKDPPQRGCCVFLKPEAPFREIGGLLGPHLNGGYLGASWPAQGWDDCRRNRGSGTSSWKSGRPPTRKVRDSKLILRSDVSQISVFSIATLLWFCSYYLRAHYRQSPIDRMSSRSRAATFITSDYFVLFVNLLGSDLLQALGFSLNVRVRCASRHRSDPRTALTIAFMTVACEGRVPQHLPGQRVHGTGRIDTSRRRQLCFR